jgi:hypothetical protein
LTISILSLVLGEMATQRLASSGIGPLFHASSEQLAQENPRTSCPKVSKSASCESHYVFEQWEGFN